VAFNVVKTVGALYLIYLGLSQWRAKVSISEQKHAEVVVPTVKSAS
jgi:homoserine/homoserine lactone efflux protein